MNHFIIIWLILIIGKGLYIPVNIELSLVRYSSDLLSDEYEEYALDRLLKNISRFRFYPM